VTGNEPVVAPTMQGPAADRARRRFKRVICLVVALFGWADLSILASAGLSKRPPEAAFDLQLLLDAGRRVAAGQSPYDFSAVAHGLTGRDLFYSYPPIVAQFFAPFSGAPAWLFLVFWGAGAAAGFAVFAALLARSPVGRANSGECVTALDAVLVAMATAPFFFPFLVGLLFGNADIWYPLLFGAVALALASRGSVPSRAVSIAGGAALAIATVVKLHPGTLMIWLAVRWHVARDSNGVRGARRSLAIVIGSAVVTGAVLLAISLAAGGIGPWRDYLDYLRVTGNADLATGVNIGPASQFALLAGNGGLAHSLAVVFGLVAVAATVVAARWVRDPLESLGWGVVASLIVLPVTWYHYPVALMPIALAAWMRSRGSPNGRRVTATLLGAYVVADAAILAPVVLWAAVALLFVGIRSSRPVDLGLAASAPV
jgi:hypothetical protein